MRTDPPIAKQQAQCSIYSILDPNCHGGLETYIRKLTDGLQQRNCEVRWNGSTPENAPSMHAIWQPKIDRLLPLMTRASTRWLARSIAERSGGIALRRDVQSCSVAHFVGIGWNLLGFAVARAAIRSSKVVTCWPAVHPGACGDSPLDVSLYNRMDAIFTQSDHERELLEKLGVTCSKLVRCDLAPPQEPTGDAARFHSRHLTGGKQLILFLGRKSEAKGYHALREAIAQLIASGRKVMLVSIGNDVAPPYPSLPSHVDLDLGVANEQDKQDAIAACDLLALPSRDESFGLVYTEAWAYGKPVLCGKAPASRELLERHQAGLASSTDVSQLSKDLERLLDDETLRETLGKNGRRAIENELNWEKVLDIHQSTWERLESERATAKASAG